MRFSCRNLLSGVWIICSAPLLSAPALAQYTRATPGGAVFELRHTAFTIPALAHEQEDRDRDCLDDTAEHEIARAFRPVFIFDSHENARRPDEPHVLYQVRPSGKPSRCGDPVEAIEIQYVYLFEWDGGYGPSSWCGNSHDGDAQNAKVILKPNPAGWRFVLEAFHHGDSWPRGRSLLLWNGTHPATYLSAGKHHPFFDRFFHGKDSPHSQFGCNDDIDGGGDVVMPSLESPHMPRGRMNVGEPGHHDPSYFVSALDALGYPGENAWSWKPFCGGRGLICGGVSPVRSFWR